jgi:hypothetical protein
MWSKSSVNQIGENAQFVITKTGEEGQSMMNKQEKHYNRL